MNLQDIFQLRLVEHPFIFKGPKKCNLPNYYEDYFAASVLADPTQLSVFSHSSPSICEVEE